MSDHHSDAHWTPSLMRVIASSTILVAIVASASLAWADHTNLEEGLPVEVSDAYPVEYLGREVQSRLQYRYTAEEAHEVRLEPRFELGFPRNGQIALHVPLLASFEEKDDEFYLGRTSLEFMYNFNQETRVLPALSLAGGVEAPDTRDGGSFDPFARANLSKLIPGTTLWNGVHLNGLVQANVDAASDERDWRYMLVAGYAVRLSPTVVGLVDAVRDQPMRDAPADNFGEVGVRVGVTPLLAVAVGGGAGANDDGDLVARGTFSFQWFAF